MACLHRASLLPNSRRNGSFEGPQFVLEDLCCALEKSCEEELISIDAAYTLKARLLQQDRAAVEDCVAEWVEVAQRMGTLLDSSDDTHGDVEGAPPAKRRSLGMSLSAGPTVVRDQACAEGMRVLGRTWRLRCGHAGAPWLSVESLGP